MNIKLEEDKKRQEEELKQMKVIYRQIFTNNFISYFNFNPKQPKQNMVNYPNIVYYTNNYSNNYNNQQYQQYQNYVNYPYMNNSNQEMMFNSQPMYMNNNVPL